MVDDLEEHGDGEGDEEAVIVSGVTQEILRLEVEVLDRVP